MNVGGRTEDEITKGFQKVLHSCSISQEGTVGDRSTVCEVEVDGEGRPAWTNEQ